ncbi:flagellar hook-basal body complex protein [Jatrophihabitans telluris]|uniref:Flagellar hook protein FlgE n=1 Tax=Jatrophihabitans telluris TaxID=2038343 RepID=A0ABY4QXU1_9ACTN|nr:flagellar hook-basal body complex protein [Jatrophihabitans telluris]UQX87957.1 flagellar hook-basal body complex protein [Jatrophihabitans telluris]
MLRSLFTGISGLRAHQQMLDVTSNNIANVNTTGFKSASTVFEDTLSQTIMGATAATATQGGHNPVQVGLGVTLGATEQNFGQGSAQYTGRTSDLMIQGDGFFVVNNNGAQNFTRGGSFQLDTNGHLVTPDGSILQSAAGGNLDVTGLTTGAYVSWSIDANGQVNAVDAAGATTTLGQIAMATFANPGGLSKIGDTQFQATTSSGGAQIGTANTGSRGSITSGYLEMSNVDLATELTNLIIAERGYQANSRVVTTSDEILQSLIQLK